MNIIEQRDKLFFLIGDTIVSFQGIEYHITEFLYTLLGLDHKDKHLLLMDALSFGQKLNLTSEVFQSKKNTLNYIKEDFDFDTARKCLSKAEQYRNKIVHSFYYLEREEFKKQKTSIKGKNGLVTKSGKINFKALEECNQALRELKFWFLMDNESLKKVNLLFDKHSQI